MLRELPEETCSRSLETRLNETAFSSSGESSSLINISELASKVVHQDLTWHIASARDVRVTIRRDDLIHPLLSGNKLYKLYGHIKRWLSTAPSAKLCSFGGAYSNHLHALAAFGCIIGRPTLGVIRGEKPARPNKTLADLERMGMQLIYLSRQKYKLKDELSLKQSIEFQIAHEGRCYWIPEGGAGLLGMEGCIALGKDLAKRPFDLVAQACGTGTTLAGILCGLNSERVQNRRVLGISALRNSFELIRNLERVSVAHRGEFTDWAVSNQYHCGGFARTTPELLGFIEDFEAETSLPVEKVYTAKVLFGISQMIQSQHIKPGTHVLVMHSGGLQGRHEKI